MFWFQKQNWHKRSTICFKCKCGSLTITINACCTANLYVQDASVGRENNSKKGKIRGVYYAFQSLSFCLCVLCILHIYLSDYFLSLSLFNVSLSLSLSVSFFRIIYISRDLCLSVCLLLCLTEFVSLCLKPLLSLWRSIENMYSSFSLSIKISLSLSVSVSHTLVLYLSF